MSFGIVHSPVCGKPAVAFLRLGLSGQLTPMYFCDEHLARFKEKYPEQVTKAL